MTKPLGWCDVVMNNGQIHRQSKIEPSEHHAGLVAKQWIAEHTPDLFDIKAILVYTIPQLSTGAPDAMSGLSIWLKYQAETLDSAPWRNDPHVVKHVATLRVWADEVEAARSVLSEATGAPDAATKWIDDPYDIDQGQMLNPAWLKLHNMTAQEAARSVLSGPPAPALASSDPEGHRQAIADHSAEAPAPPETITDTQRLDWLESFRVGVSCGIVRIFLSPCGDSACFVQVRGWPEEVSNFPTVEGTIRDALDAAMSASQGGK